MLVLRTLGRLSLATSAGEVLATESKPLLVLAVLALQPGHEAERGYLAELLWPSSGRSRALSSLRQALHQLKSIGAGSVLRVDETHCRLRTDLLEVDVWTFQRAVEDERLRDAVSVFGGPFLSTMRDKMGPELAHWADAEETRIQIALDRAFAAAIRAAISGGAASEAEEMARRFVNGSPLSEAPRLLLIEALTAQGRTLEALQEAESYRTLLREELSDGPGAAFEETVERLTEAVYAPPVRVPDSAPSPPPRPAPGDGVDDGPGARDGPGEADSPDRRPRPGRPAWAAMALLAVGAAAVGAWVGWPSPGRPPEGSPLEFGVPARLPGGALGELIVRPDTVTFAPWSHQEPALRPSPAGDRYAFIERTPRGIDLVVGERGGATRPLLTSAADEHPLDWSPDGERLLYRKGSYDEATNQYRVVLGTWEARTDLRREFPLPGFDGKAQAAWAPDGTAIAVGGGESLLVMSPAGEVITRGAPDGGFVGPVAWSPDGRRIATTVQSSGPADVYVMSRDDSTLRRVVATAGHETGVVWLGDEHLLAFSDYGTGRRLQLIDVAERRVRLLDDDAGAVPVPELDARHPAGATATRIRDAFLDPSPRGLERMVDSLVLIGPDGPVSVGEHLLFRPVPLNAEGETLHDPSLGVRWAVEGPNARKADDGVFVVESEGTFRVRVEIPGWRVTRRRLRAVEPVRDAAALPLLREDWTDGAPERWRFLGEPRPVLLAGEGPDGSGAIFLDGDQNFATAVLSRSSFSLEQGLTVEVWSRAARLEEHFQAWRLELVPASRIPDTLSEPRGPTALARVDLNGVESRVFATGLGQAYRMPLPDGLGEWRRYTLQVAPDGKMLFLVDGRVYFRTSSEGPPPGDPVRVLLAAQSVNTRILHGPLSVYEGGLYRLRE